MSKQWKSRALAGIFSGVVALGAAACSVSADPPEGASANRLSGMSALAHAAREAQSVNGSSAKTTASASLLTLAPDGYEVNDTRETASTLTFSSVGGWGDDGYASASVTNATIYDEDQDWYLLPTASLPFDVGYVGLRAMAAHASYCPQWELDEGDGPYTIGYDPPSGPENTLTVDIYNAATLALVATSTSSIGRVWLNLQNAADLGDDLYFHFHGPTLAEYEYTFYVSPQTSWFEDECEG